MRRAGQRLAPLAQRGRPLTLRVRDAGQEGTIALPAGALTLLQAILEEMASGRAGTIVPQNTERVSPRFGKVMLPEAAVRPLVRTLADRHAATGEFDETQNRNTATATTQVQRPEGSPSAAAAIEVLSIIRLLCS